MLKIILLSVLTISFSIHFQTFSQNQEYTETENKIFKVTDQVLSNPQFQVSALTDNIARTLPIGMVKKIGQSVYCIAIDNITFRNDKAVMSAYMAVDFPGTNRKLAFAANEIELSPKGILATEGMTLKLVSTNTIHLGPNIDLVLPGDGSNFVEFDCEGYKQLHLKGEFVFKNNLLLPADPLKQTVKATFEAVVEDIHNLYAAISMDPFMLKNLPEYKFDVKNAVIDLSDTKNPPQGLPASYITQLDADLNLWRGFYLSQAIVTLPEKLNKNQAKTTISVSNLFIDQAGVTGDFAASNVLSVSQGDASGFGFSVDNLTVGLVVNKLDKGSMIGKFAVPVMEDQKFDYSASFFTKNDKLNYSFSVGTTKKYTAKIDAIKTSLNITSVVINVSDDNATHKFKPELILAGGVKFGDGSNVKCTAGLDFQNLRVNTVKKYIHGGTFSLNATIKVAEIQISVNGFEIVENSTENELAVKCKFGIKLGEDDNSRSNTTFSSTSAFSIVGNSDPANDKKFKYKRIDFDYIAIKCKTTAFDLDGLISFKNDDPTFGKLFYGDIKLKVDKIMTDYAVVKAGFGKTSGYKYWFTYAEVPVKIPLGQMNITKIIGGANYHVKPTQSDQDLISKSASQNAATGNIIPFAPDRTKGLGFKVGAGFSHNTKEEIINGNALFSIAFNSSGGFSSIGLAGNAYMLVKVSERNDPAKKNKITATVSLLYDNDKKVFDANIDGKLEFASAVDGNVAVQLHIDPKDWYLHVNKPNQRASLTVRRKDGNPLATASTYFQMGTKIDPFAALPSWAQNISGASSTRSQGNSSDLSSGSGIAVGVDAKTKFEFVKDLNASIGVYATVDINFGFDLMLKTYSDKCYSEATGDKFGMNNKYCTGQIYGRVAGKLGGYKENQGRFNKNKKGQKKYVTVGGIDISALLYGSFPNPTYGYGSIHLTGSVLFIPFSTNVNVEFGDNITIVCP